MDEKRELEIFAPKDSLLKEIYDGKQITKKHEKVFEEKVLDKMEDKHLELIERTSQSIEDFCRIMRTKLGADIESDKIKKLCYNPENFRVEDIAEIVEDQDDIRKDLGSTFLSIIKNQQLELASHIQAFGTIKKYIEHLKDVQEKKQEEINDLKEEHKLYKGMVTRDTEKWKQVQRPSKNKNQ